MKRDVVITPRAKAQIRNAAAWWAANRSSHQAALWLNRIEIAIMELEVEAEQHLLALESEAFSFELRQKLFGISGKRTHRILFSINEHHIVVYAVRHLAQQNLTPDDLEDFIPS